MAYARIPDTTERFKVGSCPACKCGIYGEVDIQADVHRPSLSPEGKVAVSLTARPIAMRLHHECDGRDYSEVTS